MNNNSDQFVSSPYVPESKEYAPLLVAPEGFTRYLKNGKTALYPFTYTGWYEEELSYHDNCYLHSALNPFPFVKVTGSECPQFFESFCVNTFRIFPVGKARHAIACNDMGKIITSGIILHYKESEYYAMCIRGIENALERVKGKFDVHLELINNRFVFQLCGPRSLEIAEAAANTDLHDIKFMYAKETYIDGSPVFVLRTGMAGTLGYEIHGYENDAIKIYNKLLEVGKKYNIHELGRHAYRNAHTEGSIPQSSIHFSYADLPCIIDGSLPRDSEYIYRSPYDVAWGNMIKFNHDFPGKAALQEEVSHPHNTMVHLIWNPDDILKVFSTYFEKDSCDLMPMEEYYHEVLANKVIHMDAVYDNNEFIGVSSGRMYSPKTHEMISICTIKEEYAVEGRTIEVLWGNPGTRQMRIRASVSLFPYIKEGRNENVDTSVIPFGFK